MSGLNREFSGSFSNIVVDNDDSSTIDRIIMRENHYVAKSAKTRDAFSSSSSTSSIMLPSLLDEEKSVFIQEQVLVSDELTGQVVFVDGESVLLDVRSNNYPQKRLKLKVDKQVLIGNGDLQPGSRVSVGYQRILDYQGRIEKKVFIRIHGQAIIPEKVIDNEIKAKMNRFSYMFEE